MYHRENIGLWLEIPMKQVHIMIHDRQCSHIVIVGVVKN
jgi:hypothetical protein